MNRSLVGALLLIGSMWPACVTTADLMRDAPACPTPGIVNAVVEIPAGTTEKWEVKLDGHIELDRIVAYLGYPANYGIVPRAVLGKEFGGDGDPLDVLLLGPAVARCSTVPARVIGTIRLVDRGETDDKILAVPMEGALAEVRSVEQLDRDFPGITTILRTFFENYKGRGLLQCSGFGGVEEAQQLIERCSQSFAQSQVRR